MTVIIRKKEVAFSSLTETIVGTLFYPDKKKSLPAIIIAHGAGDCKESHNELAEHLAEKGIVSLAIDMHGHGASGGERYCVGMADWRADLIAAIDQLATIPQVDRKRIGILGISAGGAAAIEAALTDKRIKTLIVLDATVRNPLKWQHAWFLKCLIVLGQLKKKITKKEMRVSLEHIVRSKRKAHVPALKNAPPLSEAWRTFPLPGGSDSFFPDTWRRLPQLKVPTMVIWGKDNTLVSPERAKAIFAALTCPHEMHVIRGDGQFGKRRLEQQTTFDLTTDWVTRRLKR